MSERLPPPGKPVGGCGNDACTWTGQLKRTAGAPECPKCGWNGKEFNFKPDGEDAEPKKGRQNSYTKEYRERHNKVVPAPPPSIELESVGLLDTEDSEYVSRLIEKPVNKTPKPTLAAPGCYITETPPPALIQCDEVPNAGLPEIVDVGPPPSVSTTPVIDKLLTPPSVKEIKSIDEFAKTLDRIRRACINYVEGQQLKVQPTLRTEDYVEATLLHLFNNMQLAQCKTLDADDRVKQLEAHLEELRAAGIKVVEHPNFKEAIDIHLENAELRGELRALTALYNQLLEKVVK